WAWVGHVAPDGQSPAECGPLYNFRFFTPWGHAGPPAYGNSNTVRPHPAQWRVRHVRAGFGLRAQDAPAEADR
ncbi:hypothetical protein PCS76_20155, partial [Acinetobacter baumannii]|nr:hypothetical protein [Acinetobacter baumannii]